MNRKYAEPRQPITPIVSALTRPAARKLRCISLILLLTVLPNATLFSFGIHREMRLNVLVMTPKWCAISFLLKRRSLASCALSEGAAACLLFFAKGWFAFPWCRSGTQRQLQLARNLVGVWPSRFWAILVPWPRSKCKRRASPRWSASNPASYRPALSAGIGSADGADVYR